MPNPLSFSTISLLFLCILALFLLAFALFFIVMSTPSSLSWGRAFGKMKMGFYKGRSKKGARGTMVLKPKKEKRTNTTHTSPTIGKPLFHFGFFLFSIFFLVWILLTMSVSGLAASQMITHIAGRKGEPDYKYIDVYIIAYLEQVRPPIEVNHAQRCDASLLLDSIDEICVEEESPSHETLNGFDLLFDITKAELEEACPGMVSCDDALVLTAREGVAMAGGLFYPLHTGWRDINDSFADVATYELPSPREPLSKTIASFASRGFSGRETVSLLGAHIGVIHCKFFENHPYNFGGTDGPDLSLCTDFLNLMRSRCRNSYNHSPSSSSASAPCFDGSPSSPQSGVEMDYWGPGSGFGTLYYHNLCADQQLMAGEETRSVVRAYNSDGALFCRTLMMKLSNLQVLTAPMCQVPINCSRVACEFCNHLVELMVCWS